VPVIIVCVVIIALAVAPQAMLNLARLIEFLVVGIFRVFSIVFPVAYFWWLFTR
jgi:hypothetical protein